jgi:hypothetical protein
MKMKQWGFFLQYGILVLVAALLAAILGTLPLFKEAAFLGTRLKASHLVQFLGYGGALALVWLMAQRAMVEIPESSTGSRLLRHLILPVTTLMVVSLGYKVLLLLLQPFLDKPLRAIYDWAFVLGIVSAAIWIMVAWFRQAESLLRGADRSRPRLVGHRPGAE